MAGFYFEPKLRPCLIEGNTGALFHGWTHEIVALPTDTISGTLGIVEISDGSVKMVRPMDITFTDEKHAEYDWSLAIAKADAYAEKKEAQK